MKSLNFVKILLLLPTITLSQTKTISGKVYNVNNNSILPGATITIKGSATGTVCDLVG